MPAPEIRSLLEHAPTTSKETVERLLERPGVRVERIVGTGQSSPPDFWFDQPDDEWVLLVAGEARLQIEGETVRTLIPGDHIFLPAHCRHRIDWTDPATSTVWLAIHLSSA